MYEHFKNLEFYYGEASVQMPNRLFQDLAHTLKGKGGRANIQQVSFSYAYLVIVAFLYKYARFVDPDNDTYIQNSDIKQILGYDKTTKTIDKVIKKGGVLDQLGLTKTTKDFPIRFEEHPYETINNIPLREFTTIRECDPDDYYYTIIRKIVKNRNYEVKEPLFLTQEYEDVEYGTLYSFENTHKITIKELIHFIYSQDLDNIDFLMYAYFKSKCHGLKGNKKSIPLNLILSEMGIGVNAFYTHLEKLKDKGYIDVIHRSWRAPNEKCKYMDSNEYYFKGAS